jgi:ATP-dependent DNA helicase DinG
LIERYFSTVVVELMRDEIQRAGGNEILFFGWTDDGGKVDRVEVVARGNKECVTIPLEKSFLPDVVIHNHPGGRLEPSGPDLNIASITARRGVGFLIIDNDVGSVYAAVEPVLKRKLKPLNADKLAGLLSSGSPFAKRFPGFEEREGQKHMVECVCESFNQDRFALIEAGTGIGKSIAYLLPAIEWSVKNKEQVVISTNTINLQEQLLHKDIPARCLTWTFPMS